MLAAFEHIVPVHPLTWKITSFAVPEFESNWHFHREFELTYIRQGSGTRLVGDSVGDYSPGNLTLIGPEVPHTYVSTPGDTEHEAVVVQFRRDFLGRGFFDAPVFDSVAVLLDRSARGVSFSWPDGQLRQLEQLPPAEKTVALLALLLELSQIDAPVLTSEQETPALNKATAGRIESMVELMHREFASRLPLSTIAAAAHLTPSSASRLFARTTGSNITIYLTVVRVNAACRLLRDTDLNISAIAIDCGFSNLSNFNRRFRDVKNTTPSQYRAGFTLPELGGTRPSRLPSDG